MIIYGNDFDVVTPLYYYIRLQIRFSSGTGIGAWLGPVGGYGASKAQRLAYWNNTHSTQITNFELSNPEYLDAFADRCSQMVNDYDFRYFKLDGISDLSNATGPKIEKDVESFLNMLNVLREIIIVPLSSGEGLEVWR